MATARNYSPLFWGIAGGLSIGVIFYLIQSWGMQSWTTPIYQFQYRWYFILPLIIGFGIQTGLFHAIHLLSKRGGGGTMAASGSVSATAMLGCCSHNLVTLLPILGASGAAVFLSAYQKQIFLISIAFVIAGVIYMGNKYFKISRLQHPVCHHQ
jgi:Cu+-exporting ATPase